MIFAARCPRTSPPPAGIKTTMNADGSVQISRAPSAASGAWTLLHLRVIHNVTTDTVFVSDGTGGSMSGAGSASVLSRA